MYRVRSFPKHYSLDLTEELGGYTKEQLKEASRLLRTSPKWLCSPPTLSGFALRDDVRIVLEGVSAQYEIAVSKVARYFQDLDVRSDDTKLNRKRKAADSEPSPEDAEECDGGKLCARSRSQVKKRVHLAQEEEGEGVRYIGDPDEFWMKCIQYSDEPEEHEVNIVRSPADSR